MKFHIEIDCTPEEARAFLGLPDVAPMQKAVLQAAEERLLEAIKAMDAKTLMEQWLPLSLRNLEQWQSLWAQMAASAAGLAAKPRREGKG
ncbi:MAG: DUF6489 family protein [Geminicoccaceae bacterium]|nr:DUF6489 family protein [Geminicoccaceae bacterium]MCX7631104.1 DUF6489 family protein [Geminicoccaceae bacterium]MDW8125551.1 DUF6489 family protein [Geminicoccaceae bacterium]MDW8342226.1 DUF6489 family protein [Geminicoccaceae bacterium]